MTFNPFPGLRPFQTGEEHLFFGREGHSEQILRRLREARFLAVLGASGSGKSSLIRAGLLPYLHGGFMAGAGSNWRVAIFRPENDPIGNLARALNDPAAIGDAEQTEDERNRNAIEIEVNLRSSGVGLVDSAKLSGICREQNLLIVVDQFEELFRFADAAGHTGRGEDAYALVRLLLEATRQTDIPIFVVITMRSDFIGDCARYRDLPETVTSGLYLIPRMTREERREAIEEPVHVAHADISPRLVSRLLNDAGDDPDQLPILQHALMRTWDYWNINRRNGNPIDLDDYVNIGSLSDALSRHADEAYDSLPDDHHRVLAKEIFQSLTEKGRDNREVRRPTTVASIAAAAEAPIAEIITVIDYFRQPGRSFFTTPANADLSADSVIDISHESLIRGWTKLKEWVEEESRSASEYRRLAETAARHAEGRADLLREPELSTAVKWRNERNPNPAWAERYHPGFAQAMAFLDDSEKDRDAEEALKEKLRHRELRRTRIFLAIVAGALAIAVALAADTKVLNRRLRDQKAQVEVQKGQIERQKQEVEAQKGQVEEREKELESVYRVAQTRATDLKHALDFAGTQKKRADVNQGMSLQFAVKSVRDFEALSETTKAREDVQAFYEKLLTEATSVHEQILKEDPDNRLAMLFRIINRASFPDLHRSQGRTDLAKEDCAANEEDAEKLGNDRKNYFRRMLGANLFAASGEMRMQLNEKEQALSDVKRAAAVADSVRPAVTPNDVASWDLLAVAYSTVGEVQNHYEQAEKALDAYLKAVQVRQADPDRSDDSKPELITDMEQVADLQLKLHRQEKGIETLTQAIALGKASFENNSADAQSMHTLLRLYSERGDANREAGHADQAQADDLSARSVVEVCKHALTGGDITDPDRRLLAAAYRDLADINYHTNQLAAARKDVDQQIAILLPLATGSETTPADKKLLASAYGTRSWYDVLLGDFGQAIADAKIGIGYDSRQLWILTNEAHGYLFSGQFDIARKIYSENADKSEHPDIDGSRTFREAVLDDFKRFREHPIPGMDLAAMNRIEEILNVSADASGSNSQSHNLPKE